MSDFITYIIITLLLIFAKNVRYIHMFVHNYIETNIYNSKKKYILEKNLNTHTMMYSKDMVLF